MLILNQKFSQPQRFANATKIASFNYQQQRTHIECPKQQRSCIMKHGWYQRGKLPQVATPKVWGYSLYPKKYPYYRQRRRSPLYMELNYKVSKSILTNVQLECQYTWDNSKAFHKMKNVLELALPGLRIQGEGVPGGKCASVFELTGLEAITPSIFRVYRPCDDKVVYFAGPNDGPVNSVEQIQNIANEVLRVN
eukprot:Platyproteum_vivax@DN10524_c0_g1_i1.p1